ncbi:MAG: response regulator [Thermodesulfobacteriota bacterium]|nr:response regulator [Thermodesulfobacteriota bacterium]
MNSQSHVLLVDDSEDMLRTMANVLETAGFAVGSVTTGGGAIERLKRSPEIQLVILNFLLPDASGLSVLRQLRADGCEAAVIGTSTLDVGDGFLKAGAFAFMEKPFDIKELVRLCREVMASTATRKGTDKHPAAKGQDLDPGTTTLQGPGTADKGIRTDETRRLI